jgi:hypothetical protein
MIQHIAIKGYHIDYQKRNKMALAFFFFLLTLLVMLRHETVGNDTTNYIYYFERYSYMDWALLRKQELELGYVYLNKLLSLFSKESRVFLAVSAVLASAMIYPTYKRLCEDSSLTIVLYCIMSTFVMMFSGIRQMLSIGLGVVAYEFTRQKKLIPFAIMVFLAMTMHTSAFMLVFMYPLYHANITKKWLYLAVPALVVVFVFNRQIFSALTVFMARFTRFEGGVSSTGAFTMLLLFVIFTVFAFLVPDEDRMDRETIGLRNFLLLALVIQMFAPLHALAMRMSYYYLIFIPLLMPRIIRYRSRRWNQVAVLGRHVMVVVFLLYFFANAYSGGALRVFPYHFFWENVG